MHEFVGYIQTIAFHPWSTNFMSFSHAKYIHSTVRQYPQSLNMFQPQLQISISSELDLGE